MKPYPKMPKAHKRAWVKALRSGKYKQYHHFLRGPGDNNFCCLGVLQEILPEHYPQTSSCFLDYAKMPAVVQDRLIVLNDGGADEKRPGRELKEHSFKRIATWIEKHL